MLTKLFGISRHEAGTVDLHEGVRYQLPIWTVFLEPLVSVLDGVLTVVGVSLPVAGVYCASANNHW